MNWSVKPITTRDQAEGVTTWLWADHDGLHCGPDLPANPVVPTGHLWGWGEGVRVHLREDAAAPTCGTLARTDPQGAGWVAATVLQAPHEPSDEFPRVVGERQRYLACASEPDQQRVDALTLDVLVILSPTHVVLMGERA